jgi:hypothetical protein
MKFGKEKKKRASAFFYEKKIFLRGPIEIQQVASWKK